MISRVQNSDQSIAATSPWVSIGFMPSLVSRTAKEHLQLSIVTFYLSLYLSYYPCTCTFVGTSGESQAS